eukprot:gene1423-20194_t
MLGIDQRAHHNKLDRMVNAGDPLPVLRYAHAFADMHLKVVARRRAQLRDRACAERALPRLHCGDPQPQPPGANASAADAAMRPAKAEAAAVGAAAQRKMGRRARRLIPPPRHMRMLIAP